MQNSDNFETTSRGMAQSPLDASPPVSDDLPPDDLQAPPTWKPSSLVASLVYLASAAVMLMGIGQILEPIWSQPLIADEKFACVGALHAYELALLVAALVIVLWKQVVEDAVALVLLFAAFLIGAAASLDVVAPDFAPLALTIGVAATVVAAGKLWALQRWLTHPMGIATGGALMLLLAVNFLLPGLLGLTMSCDGGLTDFEMVHPWLIGWWASLIAAVVLLLVSITLPAGSLKHIDAPMLRQPVMVWHIAGILLLGTFLHQAALIWSFNLPIRLMVIHPAVGVLAIFLTATQRAASRDDTDAQPGFLALALVALLAVTLSDGFWLDSKSGLGLISHPAVYAGVMAAASAALAWQWRHPAIAAMAAGFALVTVLTTALQPGATALPHWNWTAAAAVALAISGVCAAWWKHISLAAATIGGWGLLGLFRADLIDLWIDALRCHPAVLCLIFVGLGWLILFTLAHRHVPKWVNFAAATLLTLGITSGLLQSDWLLLWQASTLLLLGVTLTAGWWARQIVPPMVGAVPLVMVISHHAGPLLDRLTDAASSRPGWVLVGAGFALLALGTLISLTKDHWLRWLPR